MALWPYEADEGEHRLWRDGRVVALTHKSFTLLVALLARAGQLVTKPELFDSVWAGRIVSDAALARALHELRGALGDDAAQPTYVETAHGLGLRLSHRSRSWLSLGTVIPPARRPEFASPDEPPSWRRFAVPSRPQTTVCASWSSSRGRRA